MQLFIVFATIILLAPYVSLAGVNLSVPFTSQAPFGNWKAPYQDFCEEASIVMAAHFARGVGITANIADAEMHIIKKYEELVLGRYEDTSIEETAMILKNLFGIKNIATKEVFSTADIKKELDLGNIVIAPAAGRLLRNPYFTPPGPIYHMLVIRGYDGAKNVFITNDPGTKRGGGHPYSQSTLFSALHDWNSGNVLSGKKMIAVVGRQ